MTRKYRKLGLLLAGMAVVVIAAGCSNSKEVGQGLETDLNKAINDLSTTSVPGASTTAAPVQNPGEASTTAPPQQTTATQARATTTVPADRQVVVTINADTSGKSQFEPNVVQARIGTPVVFKNTDTKMRYVLSPNGGFRSPDLPPGGEWTYRPNKVGTFELKDGTRPYVNGTLQVY